MRHPLLIQLRAFTTICLGIYIAGALCKFNGNYTDDKNWHALTGFFFFTTVDMMFLALTPVELVFPLERDVFLKE